MEVFSRRPAVLTSFQPGASFRIYGEKSKQLDAGYWQYSDKNQPNQQRRHVACRIPDQDGKAEYRMIDLEARGKILITNVVYLEG